MGNPANEDLRARLLALPIEHRDLDAVVRRLAESPTIDEQMLRRLRKRRLQLKDFIAPIESKLIPDLEA